jgi:hypothetical protein
MIQAPAEAYSTEQGRNETHRRQDRRRYQFASAHEETRVW